MRVQPPFRRYVTMWLTKRRQKLKLSLHLTKHHDMKTYYGVEVQCNAFLTSELEGFKWLASRPGRFTIRERAPGTN